MKKVVFLGSIIISGAVFAEASGNTAIDNSETIIESNEAVSGANDFNGFYIGAGIAFSHVANGYPHRLKPMVPSPAWKAD